MISPCLFDRQNIIQSFKITLKLKVKLNIMIIDKAVRQSTLLCSVYTCPTPSLEKDMEAGIPTEAGDQLISFSSEVPKTSK